ncbi:MAG: LysR family transcriptional regulator [Spirochaetes bacterium]|nr:LysR family transcriptional regulator [Spirochaetota bacterium]
MKNREFNFDIRQLRSFLTVINENSFTAASRKLRVGQATVSHHVGQLEKALGVKLINRKTKEILLTDEGRIFQAFCERLFAGLDSLSSELDGGFAGGLTTIAASTIPAAYILPKILASVNKKHRDISYRVAVVDSREAVEMVKEGRADAGVVGKEYRQHSLSYTPVCRDQIVLVGFKGSPDRVQPDDLARMQFIIREPGSGTRKTYEDGLGTIGITPSDLTVVMECSSTDGIKESIAAGIGVSFISRIAIEREIRQKTLKVIDIKGFSVGREFYFVSSKNRRLPRGASLIRDLLIEYGSR